MVMWSKLGWLKNNGYFPSLREAGMLLTSGSGEKPLYFPGLDAPNGSPRVFWPRLGAEAISILNHPPPPTGPGCRHIHLHCRECCGPRPPPCASHYPDTACPHHLAWGPQPTPWGQAMASLCSSGQPNTPHWLDRQRPTCDRFGSPGVRGDESWDLGGRRGWQRVLQALDVQAIQGDREACLRAHS